MDGLEGPWANRRVLVTGATGMIGSWLIKELLPRGAYVVALIRDTELRSELYRSGDIRRVAVVNGALEDFWTLERAITEHELDTVFHLGAQTLVGPAHRFPLPTFEANVRGTYNLLEACRVHAGLVQRIVVASSDKAYGEQPQLPYTEDMPLNGLHPYEASKTCADLIAQAHRHTYGLPVAIARLGNVYGGGDLNWSRIVPGTIRATFRRERPVIRSDGTYTRDYLYVKDAVTAYLRLAESLDDEAVRGGVFNFSSGTAISVLDVVGTVQKLMSVTDLEPDIRNCAEGEIRDQRLSTEKARDLLQWAPAFAFERGIRETITWYQAILAEETANA